MTDEQLAEFLGIYSDERWPRVIANLTPQLRELYERMARLEIELTLWQQGKGPRPKNVLID